MFLPVLSYFLRVVPVIPVRVVFYSPNRGGFSLTLLFTAEPLQTTRCMGRMGRRLARGASGHTAPHAPSKARQRESMCDKLTVLLLCLFLFCPQQHFSSLVFSLSLSLWPCLYIVYLLQGVNIGNEQTKQEAASRSDVACRFAQSIVGVWVGSWPTYLGRSSSIVVWSCAWTSALISPGCTRSTSHLQPAIASTYITVKLRVWE